MMPALLLLLASAAPPATTAAASTPATAARMAAPRMVRSGAFAAVELPVDDAARFTTEWDVPGARVAVHGTDRVGRGGSITPFIVFQGCAVDARGACDVSAEVSRTGPDGKVLGPATIQVFSSAPAPGAGTMMRSQAAPTFTFDGDPAGRYLLRARVTDRVAGATVDLEEAVTYTP